jgi:hypothetical protein
MIFQQISQAPKALKAEFHSPKTEAKSKVQRELSKRHRDSA